MSSSIHFIPPRKQFKRNKNEGNTFMSFFFFLFSSFSVLHAEERGEEPLDGILGFWWLHHRLF